MALRDQLAELNAALKSGRNAKRLRPLHPAVDEPAIEPRATPLETDRPARALAGHCDGPEGQALALTAIEALRRRSSAPSARFSVA